MKILHEINYTILFTLPVNNIYFWAFKVLLQKQYYLVILFFRIKRLYFHSYLNSIKINKVYKYFFLTFTSLTQCSS